MEAGLVPSRSRNVGENLAKDGYGDSVVLRLLSVKGFYPLWIFPQAAFTLCLVNR